MIKNLPKNSSDCSVALVYDRVNTPHGGAEKVLLALHELFPKAPLFTAVYNPKTANWADVFTVRTSWLNAIPGASSKHRWLVPFMPLAFESFDLSSFDLVISITSAEAKGVITLPNQLHLCYMLTPTRYLYSHQEEYLTKDHHLVIPGSKWLATQVFRYLRWWDQSACFRPDFYLPISQLVASRVEDYYHQKPLAPVYPPVEQLPVAASWPSVLPQNFTEYCLVVSRLVSYKKVDLAIKACLKLGKKLVIVGDGPEKKYLQNLASSQPSQLVFLQNQPQPTTLALMHHATAVLMPGIEDFGITALEALNQETPVIIHHQSGVAELIENKKTGIHLQDLTVNGLMKAIKELDETTFSKSAMKKVVLEHQTAVFKKQFKEVVTNLWKEHYVKSS